MNIGNVRAWIPVHWLGREYYECCFHLKTNFDFGQIANASYTKQINVKTITSVVDRAPTYILYNNYKHKEASTHSAAPSKCIHSGIQKFGMDITGTAMPAQNPVPLDIASIPKHARYIKKIAFT
jgi:hypothetical protein